LALLLAILIPVVMAAIMPWAFHMGGRWTPFLTWWGSGRLVTKSGIGYPLFVMLNPSAHFSRLQMQGRRASGGVQGNACLCISPGVSQYLKIGGTIYGDWQSTEGSLVTLRLLEPTIVDLGQQRAGYFDLIGQWQHSELVLADRASWQRTFRSGLRIDHASVTLRWDPYWSCKSACASVANQPPNRTN
jgi:hypothetical protein